MPEVTPAEVQMLPSSTYRTSRCRRIFGKPLANFIHLGMEYAPAPPFDSGTPEQAGPELTNALLAKYEMPKVREAIRRAANQASAQTCKAKV